MGRANGRAAGLGVFAVIAVAVGLVGAGGWWLWQDRSATDEPAVGSSAQEAATVDYIVWLDLVVDEAEVAAIEQSLADHDQVADYRYVGAAEVQSELRTETSVESLLPTGFPADSLVTSFEVEVRVDQSDDVEPRSPEFEAEIESLIGVDQVRLPGERPNDDPERTPDRQPVVLNLVAGVDEGDRAAIDRFLADQPAIVKNRYVDSDGAYEAFLEGFGDEPDIVDMVDPDDLWTWYELEVDWTLGPAGDDVAANRAEFIAQLESYPGVELVEPIRGVFRPTG
jgi:cell division protein FtsX